MRPFCFEIQVRFNRCHRIGSMEPAQHLNSHGFLITRVPSMKVVATIRFGIIVKLCKKKNHYLLLYGTIRAAICGSHAHGRRVHIHRFFDGLSHYRLRCTYRESRLRRYEQPECEYNVTIGPSSSDSSLSGVLIFLRMLPRFL